MKKLVLLSFVALTSMAHADIYEIDPLHTNARFAIDHFNTSTNVGGIYGLTGEMEFDKVKRTGKIDIELPLANLQSGSDEFSKHLLSADLFDAKKYPTMRFESTKFNYIGTGMARKLSSVDGKLSLLGQTHPVRLYVNKFNCYDSPMAKTEVCGGDFGTTIDRTKWGMDYLVDAGMAKNVRIDIQVEAAKK